ncbi:MAG: hypothetical protein AB2L24_08295 [Mangrovibacterium sp.]
MKKIFVKALVLILFAGFVACNDDDPAPQGWGDAYVVSKVVVDEGTQEEEVVYGLHIDAQGYYGTLSSVKVTVGTTNYTLDKNPDYDNVFSYETDEDEFLPTLPAKGTYTFTFTFATGETYTGVEALTDKALLPANITKADFVVNDKIELEWEEVDDAQAIYIRMKEADGDVIFNSVVNNTGYLEGDKTEYTISKSSGSWKSGYTMTNGVTYTVEVIALLGDNTNGFQAVSFGTATVVWGEE